MARRQTRATANTVEARPSVGSSASRRPTRGGLLGATALAALVGWGVLAFTAPASAQLPTGGTVVGGSATITTGTNQVTVNQTTNRGVIDWRSFSIGQGSRVDFQQPGASSVTLNRVTGPDPSVIAGRLTANGQIVLVNGAGVVFANGAQVNVGSLIASTASIANTQAFMADGKLAFDVRSPNANAGVVNEGSITVRDGGLVGLVGNTAANNGIINARLGRVTIGGAETFTVDLAGDGLINFQVGQPVSRQPVDDKGRKQPLASNTGTINADGGVVQMTARAAGGVVDSVVNVGGAIRAQAVTQENGVLVLGAVTVDAGNGGTVNVTGKIDVSGRTLGQRGGQVVATTQGGKVNVAATAVIDASGALGGGKVNIGGSYQGKGPLANARDTTVESGARINADATMLGSGGTVIVWADNATVFGGMISAKGGPKGGDGGFVETSGKNTLTTLDGAAVNASAVAGRAGNWLLDPTNLTIDATLAATIVAALEGGTNFAATTSATGTEPGNITVAAPIVTTTSNGANVTLTLQAHGSITVNQNIQLVASAGFTANVVLDSTTLPSTAADRSIVLAANVSTGGLGSVTLSGSAINQTAGQINTNGLIVRASAGSVQLTSETNEVNSIEGSAAGDFHYVDATGFDIDAGTELVWGAGAMSLKANDGVISINGTIRSTAPSASTTLTIDATSDGNSTVIGGSGLSVISLGNGTLNLIGAGGSPSGGINLGSRITAGIVNFNATEGVTLDNVDNVIGIVAQTASSAGDEISIRSASSLVIGPGGMTAGPGGARSGVISIISAGQVRVDGDVIAPASTSGGLFIQSTGALGILQTTGKIFSGQSTTLSATAGNIVQTGGTISGPSINLSASGNVAQTGGNIVETISSSGPSATLVVNAGGSVDLSSETNDVFSLVGAAGGDFRYVDANTVSIGQSFTVPIGITIGAGRYLEISADTIDILAGARIGGIATGSPGSSFPADNPTGVTVLRPTTANAAMVVGGSSGTTGTLLTEANLLASVQTGTLRLGSIGRAAGLQLGGAITTLENPTGTITIQGLDFTGAGQLLQRLVLESGATGTAIQQTGAIRLTRGGGFEGALATAVRGGGSVELTNPNNSVTGLAHVARESDTTLDTQSGRFRYVDESTIPVVSVAGPGTPLIGDRNSGAAPGVPANSAILTTLGDVTLVSRTGSIEFINGLAAPGAVARLSAAGEIFQSATGGVVANSMLAVAGGAVDLSTAAGLNNVRFLAGSAAGGSGGLGDFRLINAGGVTVPANGVTGEADGLVVGVTGVHASVGATLELAIASGDIVVNNTTLTTTDGLVLLRRVAGATGSEIILNNVSFDSGSGSPNLVVLDLTGSPGLLSGSFAGLKTSATPANGTSAIPLGPNPDGGILLTNVNAGNTTVYLVGGTGSTIAGSGTYGLLGVYVAHSNPITLTGSVRQIDPTTPHSVAAPFSEPFDSATFAGFYVRRRGAVVDVQTFNDCPIGSGICPTPPENEVHIPDRLQHPPDQPGTLVGTPDLLVIDFVTDRPVPTPLGLSTVILVNQGNEYFFNVDEERRKQRAARGGQ